MATNADQWKWRQIHMSTVSLPVAMVHLSWLKTASYSLTTASEVVSPRILASSKALWGIVRSVNILLSAREHLWHGRGGAYTYFTLYLARYERF